MHCIYTGKEFDEGMMSIEHIIPLSLGGSDEFTIRVEKGINSKVGSEVDGKMANDFLVMLDRIQNNAAGHRKTAPVLRIKKSKVNDRPACVVFSKEGIRVYDPVEKKEMKGNMSTEITTVLDLDLRLRFAAKVALGAGYFAFGSAFEKYADCAALRAAMLGEQLEADRIKFYDHLHPVREKDKMLHEVNLLLLSALGTSSVILGYGKDCMVAYVALFGKFISMVNFRVDTRKLLPEGDMSLGIVLQCKDNKVYRSSVRHALEKIQELVSGGKQ